MNTKTLVGALALLLLAALGYWLYTSQSTHSSTNVTSQMGNTNSGENAEPGSIHGLTVEPAAAAARKDLATKLGVGEGSIVIMLIENKTWSDGCLGLGGPAESCLAAQTEGFRVELEASGKTYVYRTDATGAAVRAESQ
jgi:hypothetical protein